MEFVAEIKEKLFFIFFKKYIDKRLTICYYTDELKVNILIAKLSKGNDAKL